MNKNKTYHYQTPANRQKLRQRTVKRIEAGKRVSDEAKKLGVVEQTIYNWRDAYERDPEHGLDHHPRGPASQLTPEQREDLAKVLELGALAFHFPTNLWNVPRVTQIIEERYGIRYDHSNVWHILTQMGFSCQVPERRARQRNAKDIKRFRQQFGWLKKKPTKKARLSSSSMRHP